MWAHPTKHDTFSYIGYLRMAIQISMVMISIMTAHTNIVTFDWMAFMSMQHFCQVLVLIGSHEGVVV